MNDIVTVKADRFLEEHTLTGALLTESTVTNLRLQNSRNYIKIIKNITSRFMCRQSACQYTDCPV